MFNGLMFWELALLALTHLVFLFLGMLLVFIFDD